MVQPRATRITELLALILSFAEKGTLFNAALVSKQWSDAALDILWQTSTDPRHLLILLAPLVAERKTMVHGTATCVVSRGSFQGFANPCLTRLFFLAISSPVEYWRLGAMGPLRLESSVYRLGR